MTSFQVGLPRTVLTLREALFLGSGVGRALPRHGTGWNARRMVNGARRDRCRLGEGPQSQNDARAHAAMNGTAAAKQPRASP